MKAQGVAWILADSLFMFGCGSDASGPGSAATSSAEIGACTGDGCPGECRQVSIKTAFGNSVTLCGNANAIESEGSGAGMPDEPAIVGDGHEASPDAGAHAGAHADDAGAIGEADGGEHEADGGKHEADGGASNHDADAAHDPDAGPNDNDAGCGNSH